MYRHEDLTGKRYGRLVATSFAGTNESGNALWNVKCDCGVCFTVPASQMKRGQTKSCGCLRRDMMIGNHRNKKQYEKSNY